MFVVSQPDVYKNSGSDTYIVFGDAKVEDLNSQANSSASQQFKDAEANFLAQQHQAQKLQAETEVDNDDDDAPELEEIVGEVDEQGVESKDIELVMEQAGVSRAEAVKALRNHQNDIVNAIMVRKFTLLNLFSFRNFPCNKPLKSKLFRLVCAQFIAYFLL